jgi:murein DD-endopeptidase MepM/ murein hydrolase activator NlpD
MKKTPSYLPFYAVLYAYMCFGIFACYSLALHGTPKAAAPPRESAPPAKPVPPPRRAAPRFAAIPASVTPGEYLSVVFSDAQSGADARKKRARLYDAAGKLLANGAFFRVMIDGEELEAAVIAPPSTCAPGEARVKIEEGGRTLGEIAVTIRARDFIAEVIPLNPANTTLRTTPDPQKKAESERLWAILSTTGTEVWTFEPFITPVSAKTRRSSFFGDRRVYEYSNGKSDTTVHAGIDYAVPRGTIVAACARGKVILARPRVLTGNSIVLEHLPGVYSVYYHLDRLDIQEGSIVEAGAPIGLSGSTGLSTGPHLHWEIRASTENADPDAFTARAVLDRAAIKAALD